MDTKMMMNTMIACLLFLVELYVIEYIWNNVVVDVLPNVKTITLWQSLALVVLINMFKAPYKLY